MYPIAQNIVTGSLSVGTTAVQVSTLKNAITQVYVKADAGNAGFLYVGNSTVTQGVTGPTEGFQLAAGEGVYFYIGDASKLYVIASQASQKVYYTITY